jgi:hypothetical protein
VDPQLQSLLTTPWKLERSRLVELVDRAATMSARERLDLSDALAQARSDTASALWLGERLRSEAFEAHELSTIVTDLTWADRQALALPDAAVVGIVSLGESTRTCIAALATIRAELPVIRAPSAIIARGVDDLGVISEVGDPGTADRCIVPVGAWTERRVWTSPTGAAALTANPSNALILEDPIRRLGPWAVDRWRPSRWMRVVDRPA